MITVVRGQLSVVSKVAEPRFCHLMEKNLPQVHNLREVTHWGT